MSKGQNIKKENKALHIADVSTRFSLTDNQIETIADLFSRGEWLLAEGHNTKWLLSSTNCVMISSFYNGLLNGC